MNWRAIRAIVRRDLKVLAGSKPVVIPIAIVPVVLFVGLPLLLGLLPQALDVPADDIDALVARLPETVLAGLPADEGARLAVVLLTYMLAPLYLIVPVMVATAVAADSIAGERERKTLEGLLLAPVSDRELLVAKVLGAWVPAVVVSLASAVLYGLVSNLALSGVVDSPPFPNLLWTLLALWVAPALAAASLGAVVLVSARVRGFQEAYQIGGLLVLPVVGLMVGQTTGALFLGPAVLAGVGAVLWLLAALLLPVGARTMQRTRLGERL